LFFFEFFMFLNKRKRNILSIFRILAACRDQPIPSLWSQKVQKSGCCPYLVKSHIHH
jgi:hypothetical protein